MYVGYGRRRSGFGEAETDLQGRCLVSGLFAGKQPVGISKPGYLRISETIEIAEGAVKDCRTTVEPDAKTPRVFPRDGAIGRLPGSVRSAELPCERLQ